ncbi:MAG: hypothetical protein J7500_15875 [Sphingomonas sp.]|uniref:hypothetical protein n=1 Tax=Sphingomonas sp. TaxID=28214 RepID=UPI001AFE85A0|nr:hypothetical protein [Sphingomonas sp.]MBO9624187.1 hypothetical protein [Sphingomonas sp.]
MDPNKLAAIANCGGVLALVWVVALAGFPFVALGILSVFTVAWCYLAHAFRGRLRMIANSPTPEDEKL